MTSRRLLRGIALAVWPAAAALYAASQHPQGSLWPFNLRAEDFEVYLNAAKILLSGGDFYAVKVTFPYLYPPIAAILAVPFTFISWWWAQILWALINAALLTAAVGRLGVRGWKASAVAAGAMLLLMPFNSTLQMGQLGVVLLALVSFDLVPSRGRRIVPRGVWLGLAAGLKLTPGLFIVHLLITRRFKTAFTAIATFAATVLIGLAIAPKASIGFWWRLAHGDSGANPDAFGWIANVSVQSAFQRFLGAVAGTRPGVIASAVLVLVALMAAWRADRAGQPLLVIGMLGIVSSVANQITWGHHLTWILPLALAALVSGLAGWLRWIIVSTVGWLAIMPQGRLPGAPNAVFEITQYTTGQKLFAAGPDLVVALLVLAVLFIRVRPAPSAGDVETHGDEPTTDDSSEEPGLDADRPAPDLEPTGMAPRPRPRQTSLTGEETD